MSIDKNLYAGINATYIRSLLLSAGFSNTDLPPKPLVLVQKFEDYLQSYDWTVDWYDSIDPTKLNDKLLSLYDELSDVRNMKLDDVSPVDDMMTTLSLQLGITEAVESVRDDVKLPEPVEAVVEPVSSDDNLQLFANHYSLIVWSSITKHHNFDVLDSEDEYANKYEEIILLEYYQDDKPYRAKDFHEFCISCPEANNIINKYIDINKLWQMGHTDEYVIEIASCFFENYDIPSEKEAYHKYAPHLIPVRDDVKLLPPVEVIPEPVEVVVPQEVVSEPQEDLSLSTTTEDKTMSIILPDFSTNGNTFTLVPVEFTSIWYEVPTVDVVELNGQYSELTCDVLNGQCSDVLESWIGKASHLTSHISDGWYGQCCDLAERPLSTEEREAVEHKVEQFANGKKAHVKSYKRELRPTQEIETLARIKELVEQSQVPTITTKSGKVVPVSPHAVTPHGNAPVSSRVTSPKVTSAIGEASAIDPVAEYKATLFNLNDYDITRNIVVDVATTTPATPATPKATVAPKVSTATFASNFNSLVMAKYRELNGGIIKDSLVLNKLTSALRANNVEAYTNLVTTFNNPVAVSLHRQAYDAVISAS